MKLITPPCFKHRSPSSEELYALQALEKGDANGHQQKLALKYIITEISAVYQAGFVPGEPDQGVFLAGRAFIGQQLFKYLNFDPTQLKEKEKP